MKAATSSASPTAARYNTERIKAKAVQSGLVSRPIWRRLARRVHRVHLRHRLLHRRHPETTSVSGRGVGMV
jgi:hypothetical protein